MISIFRKTALLEGTSLIALLFVAMPLKYVWDLPEAVKVVGWAHGLLFIAYCGLIFMMMINRGWSLWRAAIAFLAGLLPFGTFVFDRSLRKELTES